jgi:hypothetical protein
MVQLLSVAGKEGQDALTSILGAEKTGAETRKLAAEGVIKEAEAKFAPQMAQATYQKLLTDTEVAKQNARINAMNAQISREGNDLKRQELQLKVQETRQKMDSTIREKAAEIDTARTSMDNMLNTADRIVNTPLSVVGAAAGPVSAKIPTTRQSTADFEALVETLGSQAFMAQIPNLKGLGALSNAEGEKLQAALQNFSLKQSPEQLLRNVKEAQRLIRCRITCMNPNKRNWTGEIFSVGSAKIGTTKKFIPYNSPEPYHLPRILFDELKERKCRIGYIEKLPNGKEVNRYKLINEFAIEVLSPLTPEEVKEMARKQALVASGAI